MRQELNIDSEFESIIPKLTDEEFKQLEENLLADGILSPLIVWNGTIVDGHNRYKIAQKHSELQFIVIEKSFADRYECLAWICKNQLGRRNLTPENRKYLIGRRYEAEKMSHGGDRKSEEAKSSVQNGQLIPQQSTRARIADETNTTEAFVKQSDFYAKGIDAGEAVLPGFKDKVLSGKTQAPDYKVASIATCPEAERKQLAEELLKPKEQTDSNNEKQDDIENTILDSMSGKVSMFIASMNNYFARFPKLQTERKYKDRALQIIGVAKKYIIDVEGVLK